jgi:hypothetical protein
MEKTTVQKNMKARREAHGLRMRKSAIAETKFRKKAGIGGEVVQEPAFAVTPLGAFSKRRATVGGDLAYQKRQLRKIFGK